MILDKSPSVKFRLFTILFLVGIFLSKFSFLSTHPNEIILLAVIILIIVKTVPQRNQDLLIGITAMALAFIWGNLYQYLFTPSSQNLPSMVGETIQLRGYISSFPEKKRDFQRAFLKTVSVNRLNEPEQRFHEKVLLDFPQDKELDYGNEVEIVGQLSIPQNFGDFNYQNYLARYQTYTLIKNPQKILIISDNEGNSIIKIAKRFRDFLERNIQTSLPFPHSIIGTGMLLGAKEVLPDPTDTWFKESGLQHILVVSGTNVSILFFLIIWLFQKFGRPIVFITGILTLLFFIFMTGGDPPILRAGLMGGLILLTQLIGRLPDNRNFILFSGFILSMIDPKMIQSDLSFWLSFSAMLGIIIITPILDLHLRKFVSKNISLLVSASFAAQIAIFPIVSKAFHHFPIPGVFTNILVEPIVPLIMGTTGISAIFGFSPSPVNEIIGVPAYLLIEGLLWVARLLSFTPTTVPNWLGIIWGFALTIILAWGLLSKRYEKKYLHPFEQNLEKN